MHSFKGGVQQNVSDIYCHSQSPFNLRSDESGRNGAWMADLGELEHSAGNGCHHVDAFNLTRSTVYNGFRVVSGNGLQFGGLAGSFGSGGGGIMGFGGHFENWEDSGVVAEHSQKTDASNDSEDKNQFPGVHPKRLMVVNSTDPSKGKPEDQKALRRQAQNREVARKSRMRKKAHLQQLENSRTRLMQLEQDLKRARMQGTFVSSGFSGDQTHFMGGSGPVAFDMEYERWLGEHRLLINSLRSAVNFHVSDSELQLVVDAVMLHYDEIFRLKSSATKSDVLHIFSGLWKTPVERCFMWLGGIRCSDVLKILVNDIEPLTEQQLVGICNLQQSSQQTEDALSQGMEALQQSLVEALSSKSLGPRNSANVSDYMGQMAVALAKLSTLESFLHQADLLRHQTLQQLQRILSTRQAACALLAINDYRSRLRALSSLWLARPKE